MFCLSEESVQSYRNSSLDFGFQIFVWTWRETEHLVWTVLWTELHKRFDGLFHAPAADRSLFLQLLVVWLLVPQISVLLVKQDPSVKKQNK